MFALLLSSALANERYLAWSYGAATAPPGTVELEPYATLELQDEHREWTHEIELEYGILPALEGGLYFVSEQTDDGPLRFSAYQARLRYRFWPLGTRPIDMAAYLEYGGSPRFDSHLLEAKLIFAHEGQQWRAALNLTGEFEFSEEVETTLEPTVGAVWLATPWLATGLEAKTEVVFGEALEGPFVWAGPTLHLSGKEHRLSWTLSALVGLTEQSRKDAWVEARSLLGVAL